MMTFFAPFTASKVRWISSARLDKDLDGHVIGDHVVFDDVTDEVEIRIRRGGETNFDLFEADGEQVSEESGFLVAVHGLDQGLIAITQIHGTPDRRLVDCLCGPGAVRQVDLLKGLILVDIGHCGHWFRLRRRRIF